MPLTEDYSTACGKCYRFLITVSCIPKEQKPDPDACTLHYTTPSHMSSVKVNSNDIMRNKVQNRNNE